MNNKNNNKPVIRELTMKNGIRFPTDAELVMMILGSGSKENPVEELGSRISKTLLETQEENLIQSLLKIKGVGESKALAIAASVELGRRFTCHKDVRISTAKDLLPYIKHYTLCSQEYFLTTTLTGANEIINIHVASVGTVNSAVVHPREIFSHALKENASAVIVCHNHPSGICTPSEADIETTKRIVKSSSILGIPVLDHLIISQNSYFSFFEHNMMDA